MRIAVLGAGGMLGHKVCQIFEGHERVGVVRRAAEDYAPYAEIYDGVRLVDGVDALDDEALRGALHRIEPEVVVNCIGLVKQHERAGDPYLAIAVNSLLPHRLARLAAELGARLIHVSTDCVFDGTRGGYREDDLTDALDLYGRTKALGETTAAEESAITLRTSFVGRELRPPGHGLVEWFLSQEGGGVQGYAGVRYSGLTSIELARVIRRVAEEHPDACGVHQVASAPIDKYELLCLIRRIFGLEVEIERVEEPVLDRTLVMGQLLGESGYEVPTWEEMISEMERDPTPYERWTSREDRS